MRWINIVGGSCAYALSRTQTYSLDALSRVADDALYAAKSRGCNRTEFGALS